MYEAAIVQYSDARSVIVMEFFRLRKPLLPGWTGTMASSTGILDGR